MSSNNYFTKNGEAYASCRGKNIALSDFQKLGVDINSKVNPLPSDSQLEMMVKNLLNIIDDMPNEKQLEKKFL